MATKTLWRGDEYDGTGRLINKTGSMSDANRHRLFSKQYLSNPDEYDFGWRKYSPTLQRFTSQDPLQEAGGFNLYQAMGNNAVNYIDPLGDVWYKPWTWFQSYPTPSQPSNPYSYKAMRDAMIGDPSDYDFNGQTAGQVTRDIGMAVPKGILAAAGMMTGVGEGEGAYAAADEALQAARAAKGAAKCLPKVAKAVNSELPHAAAQAAKRGVFDNAAQAADALRDLSKAITQNGFPAGTLPDTAYADRVLVPIGNNGMAVYQVGANGTAKLKTVLVAH